MDLTLPSIRELLSRVPNGKYKLRNNYLRVERGLLYLGIKFFNTQPFLLSQKRYYELFGRDPKTKEILMGQAFTPGHYLILKERGSNLTQRVSSYYFTKEFKKELVGIIGKISNGSLTDIGINAVGINSGVVDPTEKEFVLTTDLTIKLEDIGRCFLESLHNSNWVSVVNSLKLFKPEGAYGIGEVKYHEDFNGRIHNRIQQIPSHIRDMLFNRWHKYDISTSSPTILLQICSKFTDKQFDLVNDYVNNKQYHRELLANKYSVDISVVKDLLTSLFFGAVLPSEKQIAMDIGGLALVKSLSGSKDIVKDPWVVAISKEIKQIFNIIVKHTPRSVSGVVVNSLGKSVKISPRAFGQVVHHIYVGAEREILNVIVDFVGRSNVVYIHDGFISKHEVDINELEKRIAEQTQFVVKFS